MANDLTLPIRRANLTALKASETLTQIVPAASIHPQSPPPNPTWPFVKHGVITGFPIRANCVDGNEAIFSIHGFAKARTEGGVMVETAEDHAARIGAFIASALDRKRLPLDGGLWGRVRWTGSQLMQDGDEADAYHSVQNFRVRVLA